MSDPKADLALLVRVAADVRRHVPGVRTGDAWVNRVGPWHWDFYFSRGAEVFSHFCTAPTAHQAKAKGWGAYLAKLGVEEYC